MRDRVCARSEEAPDLVVAFAELAVVAGAVCCGGGRLLAIGVNGGGDLIIQDVEHLGRLS